MVKDATKKTHEHEPELEIPDKYEETRQWPKGHPSRRETLCRKAEQEDGPVPTWAEFQEMLKDPDVLYEDIIELIENGTISSTPVPPEGRKFMKLPDPPLFDSNAKDRVTYDNWLIQVENKFYSNADVYPTEDLKIIYVVGQVSKLYYDSNKEQNAWQAFKDLTIKKEQTFQEFYAIFLRYVADSNISPCDLKDELNDKLS
ncbi:hypothetical protein GP486_002574 [Trichoglossum hirsutum]|uniref:Uncharacterized protein n=1 Tax=Trichoglossum hirsutum TaxID=265104 RepID=A0A9P8RRK9_9PEZI|nr:hypothetical protein GP486_002574 [Trichoglossum hirsutum]